MAATEVIRFRLCVQPCPRLRFPAQIPFELVISLSLNLRLRSRCPHAGAETSHCLWATSGAHQ
jgi:hypothetical protein